MENKININELKKPTLFRVHAEIVTYCYIDVEAGSIEDALDKANSKNSEDYKDCGEHELRIQSSLTEQLNDWICTDIDTNQYRKFIADSVYLFKEDRVENPETNEVSITEFEVNVKEYLYNDIDSWVSSYGYKLLDNYLLEGYTKIESIELIAECIFEMN